MKLYNILSTIKHTTPFPRREGLGMGLFGLCLLCFTACETIDEADRWTEPAPVEMKKNVLVEDFTGQNCVNCPAAAELIHNLSATKMGEHIVAVSIHGGAMSIDATKSPFGLALPIGEEYNKHWGIQAWPSGIIDRTGGVKDVPSWSSSIVERMSKDLVVDLEAYVSFDKDTRTANITVAALKPDTRNSRLTVLPIADNTSDMRLTVWLTESNIVGRQKFTDYEDDKYVHNHVLRHCLTDPYGDALTNGQWSKIYEIPKGYGMGERIKDFNAKPENMAVVTFITDKNGEVLQVIDTPLEK